MNNALSSPWLRIWRAVLLGYVLLIVLLSVVGAFLFPAYARVHAAEFTPNAEWTTAQVQDGLRQLGWPATLPAYLDLGRGLLALLAGGGVSLLLLWRKPDNAFTLYLAFVLVSFGNGEALFKPLYAFLPGLQAYNQFVGPAGWQFFFILFYFFPNGRSVPGWSRWLAYLWLAAIAVTQFVPSSNLEQPLIAAGFYILVISALASQFYRYFWRSGPVQRQQTKWVVAVLILMLIEGLATTPWSFKPPSGPDLRGELVFALFKLSLDNTLIALVPVAIAIAIFRYRLWDIDLVIRRTLQYGLLTTLLGLVYFGGVSLLQQVFNSLTGQQSPLAVVLSTLVIAVLFTPLRRGLQTVIDRRFYRRRYDAETVVGNFTNTVRNEMAVATLGESLVQTARETLEPQSISLWLAQQEEKR